MDKIRVLIADDHPIVRKGLLELLQAEPDMLVVDEAGDGLESVEKVRVHLPDVLLLDIVMPRMNGLDAATLIRDASPGTRIVVLSMYGKEAYVRQALQAGVLGYLLKTEPWQEIPAAVRAAHAGCYFLNTHITSSLVADFLKGRHLETLDEGYQSLSSRERQIFQLLAQGNSTVQISDILCISPKTVEKYRLSIAGKLGTDNPIEMVKYAVRIGLVDPDLWES